MTHFTIGPTDVVNSRIIQQYGSERSGTVLLQKLALANLEDVLVISGGKHAGPATAEGEDYLAAPSYDRTLFSFIERDGYELADPNGVLRALAQKRQENAIRYLISVRNPYAVVLSWLRRGEDLEKAVYNWNQNNRRYYHFYARHREITVIVHLELLNQNRENILHRIATHFEWPVSDQFFTDVRNHAHADPIIEGRTPFEKLSRDKCVRDFDREFEMSAGYMLELGTSRIALISKHLDCNVCNLLGYPIE